MAFIARVEKPCTYCNVVIPKGTANGFTWDRTKGGFIHLECMRKRKGDVPVAMPCARCGDTLTGHTVTENSKTYHAGCLPASGDAVPLPAPKAELPARVKKIVQDERATQLIEALQSLMAAPGIDEKEVRRIAADEAAKVSVNRSISISIGELPEIKLDLAHKDLPLLVKVVSVYGANGHRPNVYMHGPAGSGKSTAARQASEVLKLDYGYISLNPQTPDSRLLGYMHAGGEYVASEFFKRYTQGGVFCIDEIDNAAASLVTTLNGLLENGHGAFPHGVFQRHKDFVCVCTANTIGRGGDINYPERRQLDGAFLERFMFLEWEYDTDLTKAIVTGILGNAAAEFMRWVEIEARDMQARYPTLIVSPRAHIQGAVLEKMGLSRNQIKPMVIARGLK
jgi:hypothetical protein